MDTVVEKPQHEDDEGKLSRLFEGPVETFPGNASVTQFFQSGLGNRIDPEQDALIDDEVRHTFGQLDERSARLAEAIRQVLTDSNYYSMNPDRDIVIGVCIPPSDKLVITLLAIMKLGAAYLPYEVSFPEDRVLRITENACPVLIVSDSHTNVLSKFDVVKSDIPVVSTAQIFSLAETLEVSEEDLKQTPPLSVTPLPPEKTAIILYTSGSSGEPKGVRLSHRTIMNRLHWQWQAFPFVQEERCVFKTSLTFVDSVAEIFGPLLQGYPLVVFPKTVTTNPNIFIQKLGLNSITRLVLVPSLLRAMFNTLKIVDEARAMLDTVKLWVCSGEPLTKDLVLEFFENFQHGFTICNFYGSTEIMGDVTYLTFSSKQDVYNKSLEHHIPIGQPIFNSVIYLMNDEMEMVGSGELGEIYVGGYNLAKGYVGMSEDPRFVANPFCKTPGFNRLYKTGDFAKIAYTQGKIRTIVYEGRVDSQIKVRGQRVDLSEIEMQMSGIHLISKVKVLCYHPGQQDQNIVAFIVKANDAHIDRIKMLVETKVREYERPVLRVVDEIPLLVNGKTDRQRLLKLYEQDLDNRSSMVDWSNLIVSPDKIQIARIVVTTMSEVTGTDAETIIENLSNSFFNVGGSSLNSIQVIVKLREKKCFVTIPDFVSAKSIQEIIEKTTEVAGDVQEPEEGLSVLEQAQNTYDVNYLMDSDKEDTCHIIATSFSHHGDLEKYTDSTYDDFQRLIQSIWDPLVEKGFSFIVRRKETNQAVGIALNFDVYDEPEEIEACNGILYVLELLEFIESRQREKLPKGKGKLVHSFMMGTLESIDESENVLVIQFMEELVIQMAREKEFMGIMTTNTNPLTQQIANGIHGYETLFEYQVNKYVAPDGSRPFGLAPDSFIIICCWKNLAEQPDEKVKFQVPATPNPSMTKIRGIYPGEAEAPGEDYAGGDAPPVSLSQ